MNYLIRTAGAAVLFCLGIHYLHAQNNEIDSLKKSLQHAPPEEKMKINYSIGSKLFEPFPDSAIRYFNEALKLSQQMHNDTFTARCLNKIGNLNYFSGEYEKAITNLFSALKIFERLGDKQRTMICLQYLGMAYNEQGMYDKALDYANQSIEIAGELGDSSNMAAGLSYIGSVYYSRSDYDKALTYFQQALRTAEEIKDQQRISEGLNNVAVIYEEKKKFSKALEYHLRSLALTKELDDKRGISATFRNIGLVYKGMEKFPVAIQYLDSAITLAKEAGDKSYMKDFYNSLSEIYSSMGNFEKAYQTHLLYSQLNDTLMSEENKRQFAEMNTKYETEKKDNQITLLNKDSEKQRIIRNGFMGGFAVVLVFAGVFFAQRNKIKKGKQRSDELLLNILPAETAEELKTKGNAEAKQYEEVTVMFTDFENFTQASEKLSATELVKEIHHCYCEFDKIITKHGLEKIKTIGDSYMCAGGLPVPNKTNAEDIVMAALEICQFMEREMQKGKTEGKPYFEIRIGCHTGPVVAGIVGIKKFAYDIWGDTVNIASRMESSGEAGKVNISGTTYELVKDKFNCSHRGKIQAKNKGEIDMYFVDAKT
jgi:adenylate cyclase